MLKAWIFISTLAFLMTSFALPIFNTSPIVSKKASIKNNSAPEISFGKAAVLSPVSGDLCAFFPKEVGKVIKSGQFKEATFKLNTVVIDPGHGGYDSGCLGAHSQEKHLALNISKMLAAQIQKAFPDVRVILTRSTDKFVPLHERATIANTNKADLFISIHCNAMTNASWIKGSETYVLGLHRTKENLEVAKRENAVVLLEEDYEKNYDFDPNSDEGHILLSMVQNAFLEQSIQFASKVENHMENHANRHSRGVKQAGFQVLRQTAMPSVLVEAGFLTNETDEKFLHTTFGQRKIADAIFLAFREYKAELEDLAVPESPLPPIADDAPRTRPEPSAPVVVEARPPEKKPEFVAKTVVLDEPFPTRMPDKAASPIQFRVQLAASPRPIDIRKGKWAGLPYTIEVIEEGRLNKYQISRFQSFESANAVRKELQHLGFKDAFVVAYQNGRRVDVAKARQASTTRH